MAMLSHIGRILIARPDFVDLDFDMTVTMLLEHSDTGALGLVLNRPSDVTVQETFADWADSAAAPQSLFAGGPVNPESIMALGRGPGGQLVHGMSSIDLNGEPSAGESESSSDVRIFAGYAGWAAGQLEGEILNGGWWLVDGTVEDVFSAEPAKLWSSILRRQPGELAWYAHYPADASTN